jgi:threonine dehydrogenase-like Zn-dependent dehydrogenase
MDQPSKERLTASIKDAAIMLETLTQAARPLTAQAQQVHALHVALLGSGVVGVGARASAGALGARIRQTVDAVVGVCS